MTWPTVVSGNADSGKEGDGQTGRPGGRTAGGRQVGAGCTWDDMNEIKTRNGKCSRVLTKK